MRCWSSEALHGNDRIRKDQLVVAPVDRHLMSATTRGPFETFVAQGVFSNMRLLRTGNLIRLELTAGAPVIRVPLVCVADARAQGMVTELPGMCGSCLLRAPASSST